MDDAYATTTAEWLAAESPPPYTSGSRSPSEPEEEGEERGELHFYTTAPLARYPEFMFIWDSEEDRIFLPSLDGGFEKMTIEEIFAVEGTPSPSWYYMLEPFVGVLHRVNEQDVSWTRESQPSQTPPEHSASRDRTITSGASPLSQSFTEAQSNYEIPEALQCSLCGDRIEARFKECTHGTCKECLIGTWRGRRKSHNHLPTWFPCPFCRAEISHIGILSESRQPRSLGFGDDFEYTNVVLTVWRWQPVRRWIALRDESVARLLGLNNACGLFSVELKVSGTVVVEQLKFPVFLKAPVGVLPPGTSWTFFVVFVFLVLKSVSEVSAG